MVKKHDFFLDQETTQHEIHGEELNHKNTYQEAPRLDRLAASLFDFMLIIPMIKVFAFQSIVNFKLSLKFEMTYTFLSSLFNIFWLGFSVLLIYKFLSHRFFDKTLGQMIFKIKTVNNSNHSKIDGLTLIQRTFFSVVSIFLIFPLFAVFLERRSRTFYDKILGTLVVSTKKEQVRINFNSSYDKIFGAVLIFNTFLMFSFLSIFFMKKSFQFGGDFVGSDKVCNEVSKIKKQWAKNKVFEERLEVALALYSVSEITTECLSQEVDFELSVNNASSTAYFAKGLLKAKQEEVSLEYFKNVCKLDQNSPACEIVLWINFWPNNYEGEVIRQDYASLPTYYKIWDIKRSSSKGKIFRLSQSLSEFHVLSGLEYFYANQLLRTQFYDKKIGNFENLVKLAEYKTNGDSELKESYCSSLISESCQLYLESQFCSENEKSLSSPGSHLSNMKLSCESKANKVFSENKLRQIFYEKMAKKEVMPVEQIKMIFLKDKNDLDLRIASLNYMLNQTHNIDFLNLFRSEWSDYPEKDYFWRVWGEKLKSKLTRMGETQSSFEIYKILAKEFDEPLVQGFQTLPLSFRQPSNTIEKENFNKTKILKNNKLGIPEMTE